MTTRRSIDAVAVFREAFGVAIDEDAGPRDWLLDETRERLRREAREDGRLVGWRGGIFDRVGARPFVREWGAGWREGRAARERAKRAGKPAGDRLRLPPWQRGVEPETHAAVVAARRMA